MTPDGLDVSNRIIENYKTASDLYQRDAAGDVLSMNGFFNLGLWAAGTRDLTTACRQLVDAVVEPMDEAPGAILDVGCGEGGTTGHLAGLFPKARVTGINVSAPQLAAARAREPACRFLEMDAAHLEFDDGAFDCVVCIEAAFHFHTRAGFLSEALRVLRPGGWLLMTDIVFARPRVTPTIPEVNFLRDVDHFEQTVADAGFAGIQVQDVRSRTVAPFNAFVLTERLARAIADPNPADLGALAHTILECTEWHTTIDHYLVAHARRPMEASS